LIETSKGRISRNSIITLGEEREVASSA